MTATNSPTKEHLPPLQAVIDRTIDKYTEMKEYKRPDRHTHRENSQLTVPEVTFLSKVWHYKTVAEAMDAKPQL